MLFNKVGAYSSRYTFRSSGDIIMKWSVALIVAFICLVASFVAAFIKGKSKYKSGSLLEPSKIIFIGVVVSAFVLFLPIYNNTFKETDCGIVETILISIHNMIRLFIVDGEFEVVTSNLTDVSPLIFKCYTLLFSVLFVMAPILTFGFVLSFFKNISAYKLYVSNYNVDAFIFSELNEKSLALAESLYNNDKKDKKWKQ